MAKRDKQRDPAPAQEPGGGLGGLAAALAGAGLARAVQPAPPSKALPAASKALPAASKGLPAASKGPSAAAASSSKVVVRMERAGRGGHTATIVEGVAAGERDELARALRKGLGAGAVVDGARIVVQGDLVERVATLLEGRGLPRVVRGN